ncbi:uncharacterized protein LOC119338330 [Triticum dicoccoides]|uniref:uncharacterized protein LOC119338330 n=1 Tax=Triticum dicoccoides TaxID=85692 RepID=UPI001891A6ED|nr:uncharacterized protein LOC119338330 [Triticum dicoccoides]
MAGRDGFEDDDVNLPQSSPPRRPSPPPENEEAGPGPMAGRDGFEDDNVNRLQSSPPRRRSPPSEKEEAGPMAGRDGFEDDDVNRPHSSPPRRPWPLSELEAGPMAGRNDFEDDDVNPFAGGSVPPASNSRLSPLPHEPAGLYNVDIPMDSTKDVKRKEKELKAMEPEPNKREKISSPVVCSGATEVRLYKRSEYGSPLVQIAALVPVAPPRAVEGGSDDPGQEFAGEPTLYLAVVQDGHTIDIARLLFHGGEPALEADKDEDYYAAAEFSSSEDDRSLSLTLDDYAMVKSNWSDDDWAVPSTGVAMSFLGGLGCKEDSGIRDWDWDRDGEDEDVDGDGGDGEDGDGEDGDEDEDEDGEDEDEDEDGSNFGVYDSGDDSECSKEDGDVEDHGDTEKDLIKLRIWPAQKHLLLKFFSGKQWKLTKAYRLIWLKCDELEELCKFSFKMDGPIPAPFTTTSVPSGTVDNLLAFSKPSINSFQVCKKLGKASDCKIFKCLISGSRCAVKCIPLHASCFEEPREVKIISSLRNRRIMRLFQPDNIFLGSDYEVRIGDFGDACCGQDEFGKYGGTPNCGTKSYLAPELDGDEKITEKVDIYSVGVMFFELLTPFGSEWARALAFEELRDKGPPDGWKGDYEGDREFYDRMTALKPADRPSVDEILLTCIVPIQMSYVVPATNIASTRLPSLLPLRLVPLLEHEDVAVDLLYAVRTVGMELLLVFIHIFITPIKRFLQTLWDTGMLGFVLASPGTTFALLAAVSSI